MACISFGLVALAFHLILRLKTSLFVPLKAVMFFSIVTILLKIISLTLGGEYFVEAYLAVALLTILLITLQLNRITIRSNILNYLLGLLFVASCAEIVGAPRNMLSEEFTVLPIRNSVMLLSAIINVLMVCHLIRRARYIQKNFKGLVKKEFLVLNILIIFGAIQVGFSAAYLLALWDLYIEILKALNYFGMIIGTIVLLLLCFYLMKIHFFLSFSGLTGITISIGDVVITSIGDVPKEILPYFMRAPYNDITYISDRMMIKVWKTRISYGSEQKDFLFMAVSKVYEYDAEKFLVLLALSIEDRVKRDYLLKKKLLNTEYLMKQIESPFPPRFLKEEFQKALYEYRKIF